MGKHERDGVHAVGESVRDDRERDRHPHRRVNLESKPDANAVEKAVADERRSGKRADVRMVVVRVVAFVVMVDEDGFFQKVENEETRGERDHRMGRVEIRFVGDFEDFRKDFESGDSQKDARGERHDEMKAVFEFERNVSPEKYRDERDSGKYGGIEVHNAKNDDKAEYIQNSPTPNAFEKSRLVMRRVRMEFARAVRSALSVPCEPPSVDDFRRPQV